MSETIKISAVIITFNEESNIERCIHSLEGVADEVVVVDSFSTDRTKEICENLGVRFIEHAFEGHIEQKNWARLQATHTHVLSLDADEALDDQLRASILKVKSNWQHDGYKMNRLTNYCGKWIKHSGWYPDVKLRLWDNSTGEWTGENPHDEFKLFEKKATVGHIKGDILHYSYHVPEDHDKQIEYFTSIAAKAHLKAGKGTYFLQPYISAVAKFFKCYLIKLGFLDGKEGWIISKKSSYAAYLKYNKIKLLKKGIAI